MPKRKEKMKDVGQRIRPNSSRTDYNIDFKIIFKEHRTPPECQPRTLCLMLIRISTFRKFIVPPPIISQRNIFENVSIKHDMTQIESTRNFSLAVEQDLKTTILAHKNMD